MSVSEEAGDAVGGRDLAAPLRHTVNVVHCDDVRILSKHKNECLLAEFKLKLRRA